MKYLKCPHCKSTDKAKKGFMKSRWSKTQIYQCKSCKKKYSKRNKSINYRKRKQNLREKITKLYCERMSLNGIARVLKIDRKTVVRYFRENAGLAKQANKKRIAKKELVTSYVQFDQLETFQNTKRKPIGIQIAIRWKTGEIIAAKAGYIPIRALTVPKSYVEDWNSRVKHQTHIYRMLNATKKALNQNASTITCDQDRAQVKAAKQLLTEPYITIDPSSKQHKKIDRVFRRMRQDISRLGRRTLSTTKCIHQLQNHLDLYIDYNNVKRD